MIIAEDLRDTVGKSISLRGKKEVGESEGIKYPGFNSDLVYSKSAYINFDLVEDNVEVTEGSKTNHDGIFIGNKDGKIILGYLGQETGVIISDQYAGCDFQMLRVDEGGVVGAHVYSDDQCRNVMADELPNGWKTIGTWKSTGLGTGDVDGKKIGGLVSVAYVDSQSVELLWLQITGYPPKIAKVVDGGVHYG